MKKKKYGFHIHNQNVNSIFNLEENYTDLSWGKFLQMTQISPLIYFYLIITERYNPWKKLLKETSKDDWFMMGQDCITPKNEGKYNKCHMLNQNVNSLFF